MINAIDLVNNTILKLSGESLSELKELIIGKYIRVNYFRKNAISKWILAEKIVDYFEMLSVKGDSPKKFDKYVNIYLAALNSVVQRRIAAEPKTKGETVVEIPRARKYYNKAMEIKKKKDYCSQDIIDYSRIMLCLYSAIIKNENRTISDFDYSVSSILGPEKLLDLIAAESVNVIGSRPFFYRGPDSFIDSTEERTSIILLCVLLCTIINENVQGELYHG